MRFEKLFVMANMCQITGKMPMSGNNVSHSNRKTRRKFLPNIQTKKFFWAEEDVWVTLNVSAAGIRNISKKGLNECLKEAREKGFIY